MSERSKELDSSSSVFALVGSNPTECISFAILRDLSFSTEDVNAFVSSTATLQSISSSDNQSVVKLGWLLFLLMWIRFVFKPGEEVRGNFFLAWEEIDFSTTNTSVSQNFWLELQKNTYLPWFRCSSIEQVMLMSSWSCALLLQSLTSQNMMRGEKTTHSERRLVKPKHTTYTINSVIFIAFFLLD